MHGLVRRAVRATVQTVVLASLTSGTVARSEERTASPTLAVVNLSERDLERVLENRWLRGGRWTIEGNSKQPKPGVQDLRYRAVVGNSSIRLAAGGRVSLRFDLEDAELQVARFERRLLGARARCEELRVSLDPEPAVVGEFEARFAIDHGALRVSPESLEVANLEAAIRIDPTLRCRHAWIPDWLLRAAGRSRVRRTFRQLDESLLTRARREASRIDEAGGVVRLDSNRLALQLQRLDTAHHALWLGLGAESANGALDASTTDAEPVGPSAKHSFVALSPEIGRRILHDVVARADGRPRVPSAHFLNLVKSDAFVALFPSLTLGRERLRFALRFESLPTFEFLEPPASSGDRARPGIRIELSGLVLDLYDGDESESTRIGSVFVRRGRLTLAPFVGPRGGLSFDVVDNDWRLEGRGVAIADEVFAATLQELVFGEAFETTFEPLARTLLATGAGRIALESIEVRNAWLVVGIRLPDGAEPTLADGSLTHPVSARSSR